MKKYILTTVILLSSFICLLLSTFLLNDFKIKENVSKSLVNYNFLDNKKYNLDIDNYTDMIMLNIITYNNENSFVKRTFGNKYGILYVDKYGDKEIYWNQYENLKSSLNNENHSSILYGRFWHGYQIIIKPLLRFFTYQQSLVFLTIIGIILIVTSCILIFKKLDWKYLIIYILSLLSLNIYVFNTCYQYFFSMILMITFIIIILFKYNKGNFNSNLYFYIFGALTSYFLYISFPLITLCYPLIIFLALEFKNGKAINYKQNISTIIKNSISWFTGYVLFFLFKWILGTFLVGTNFIEDALMSVSQRLGITFSFNYFDILKLNLSYFFNNKLNIVLLIIASILIIIKIRNNFKEKIKIISPILLIFTMPFIWIFVCNNHSAVHYWMIARLFSISIFALFMCVIALFENSNYDKIEKLNKDDYFLLGSIILFIILYKINLIFILISILLIIFLKPAKKQKIFIILLILLSSFLLIMKFINKSNFNNKEFFKNTYNELYHKAITYGEEYLISHNTTKKTKVDIRDLIDTVNSDSVFLLSCKGYVMIDSNAVTPYINCNDTMVTDGYIED